MLREKVTRGVDTNEDSRRYSSESSSDLEISQLRDFTQHTPQQTPPSIAAALPSSSSLLPSSSPSRSQLQMSTCVHSVKSENAKQEVILEDMSVILNRLGVINTDITIEVTTQMDSIHDCGLQIDETESKLRIYERKLDRILKSTGISNCTWILILSVILTIVICMIIFT